MRLKGWLAGTAVLVILTALAFFMKPHSASFHRLQEVKAKLNSVGLICSCDNAAAAPGFGFLVSREAVSWSDVGTLCKIGPMGPAWKGKVWVCKSTQRDKLESLPDGAGVRVWGEIIAFGDSAFLSQIDDALTESPFDLL